LDLIDESVANPSGEVIGTANRCLTALLLSITLRICKNGIED